MSHENVKVVRRFVDAYRDRPLEIWGVFSSEAGESSVSSGSRTEMVRSKLQDCLTSNVG
jgi:hypothetical protein